MLTIFPLDNEVYKREILKNYSFGGMEQSVLIMKENGIELGYIVIDVDKYKIYILDIVFINIKDLKFKAENKELLDFIVRSTASFALNRDIFILCSKNENLFEILISFGFEKCKDLVQMDLSKIINKCKNCNSIRNQ